MRAEHYLVVTGDFLDLLDVLFELACTFDGVESPVVAEDVAPAVIFALILTVDIPLVNIRVGRRLIGSCRYLRRAVRVAHHVPHEPEQRFRKQGAEQLVFARGESRKCARKARYRAHYLYGAHRENGLRRAVPVVVSEVGGKAVDHDYGRRVAAAFRAVGECTGGKHNEHDGRKNECYGFFHVCSSLYDFTALKSKERGHKVGDDRHNYSRYKYT